MPFGLKNVGATYRRMMNKVFEDQLGQNIEPGETLFLYLSVEEEAVSSVLVRETENGQEPIFTTARRLGPYFQAHKIVVQTSQLIRQVLHKPDLAGRMISWAIELSEFDITWKDVGNLDLRKVYVEGSSNSKGSGAGIIVESPEGIAIEHSL
ncbi:hypothetical protein K1719_016067 [Acacia pycnantha]|nr:hypothetical protein K1719_016067 [Acacia pycnantha]